MSEADMHESTQTKACTKCGEAKPVERFGRDRSLKSGLKSWCKDCVNDLRRLRYEQNREEENARGRAWRRENRERHRELTARWESANLARRAESRREWREENRETLAAKRRAWLEANPGYYQAWGEAHQESIKASQRKYRSANPGKNAEAARRRRARERQAAIGDIDLGSLWTGECSLCGEVMDDQLRWPDPLSKSIDHIIPLSKGGGHVQGNLAWAHLICNMRKGARLSESA